MVAADAGVRQHDVAFWVPPNQHVVVVAAAAAVVVEDDDVLEDCVVLEDSEHWD